MRIAVIGAGLSGLAAAGRIADAGHEVVLFEKSRGLGGRLASRRVGDVVVDHGAPAVDGPAGSALAAALVIAGAVRIGAPTESSAAAPMQRPFTFPDGVTRLAKSIAADMDVVRGVRIATIRRAADGLELGDEQGNGHGRVDGVVVSAPAPQAADLLERSPVEPARVALLRTVAYDPAVMVIAAFRPGAAPEWFTRDDVEGFAVVACDAAARGTGGRPVVLVARLTPESSAAALDDATDEAVLADALPRLAGLLDGAPAPEWSQVKRWRYCVPRNRVAFDAANPPGERIVVCGDAVAGPGMADVWASGLAAADRLLGAPRDA